MNNVIEIGRCKGCDRRARLDQGVCLDCLNGPKRGRKWAEMAYRCRTDPEFALSCYNQINTKAGKKLFEAMYGIPKGATRTSAGPILTLVDDDVVNKVMEA